MTPTTGLQAVAWRFLRSEFAGRSYADWPIERRIEAYLLHNGPSELRNDGSVHRAVLECVMANIGRARRVGVLPRMKG